MTRKPSCLISCSHASPLGGCGALVGRQGGMKPDGRGIARPIECWRGARQTRGSGKDALRHPAPRGWSGCRVGTTGKRRLVTAHTQDRRVTAVTQGLEHPALSEGSRLFWALLSPVHERLGYRVL